MTIDLSRVPETMNAKFVPLLFDEHRLEIVIGGANSSKSFSIAQKIIYKTLVDKRSRWLAARKVKKDVRHSIYDTLKEAIRLWKLEPLFKYNDTECTITCMPNHNDIIGVGLDDVDKLKSIFNPTSFWIDEADQTSKKDLTQLQLRLRDGDTSGAQVLQGIISMNPIHIQHWIKTDLVDNLTDDMLFHHSTYLDNEHLSPRVKEYMRSITDPYYKAVYVDGEWGVYGSTVFDNFIIEDFDYTEDDLENVSNGMDFGTVHASTLERLGWKDNDLYFFDELYGKGWTNPDFIQAAEDYWPDSIGHEWDITADSAEPDRIIEWNRAGWRNVVPAKKGPGSLGYGIDFLRGRRVHIHRTKCPNLAREFQQFKHKEDKNGEPTEGYVEINDDCIAAGRYATEYMWNPSQAMIPANFGAADLGL